jgi:hypothetical protein
MVYCPGRPAPGRPNPPKIKNISVIRVLTINQFLSLDIFHYLSYLLLVRTTKDDQERKMRTTRTRIDSFHTKPLDDKDK